MRLILLLILYLSLFYNYLHGEVGALCMPSGDTKSPFILEIIRVPKTDALLRQITNDFVSIIKFDLVHSSAFTLTNKYSHLSKNLSSDAIIQDISEVNDVHYLLSIGIDQIDKTRVIVYTRLYDSCSGRYISAKSLEYKIDGWRRAAHIVSDSVYSSVLGTSGYFNTKVILMTSQQNDPESKRILISDYDNFNSMHITNGEAENFDPNISEDAKRVVYSENSGKKSYIVIQNLTDNKKRRLDICSEMCSFPKFSHDGSSLLFTDTLNGASNIKLYDLAENTLYSITNDRYQNSQASYSPDESLIVFVSNKNRTNSLYIANLTIGTIEKVSSDSTATYSIPAWSPTGEWIAFSKVSVNGPSLGILRPDKSEEVTLLKGTFESLTWVPSGDAIAFIQSIQGEREDRKRAGIFFLRNKRVKYLSIPGTLHTISWSKNIDYTTITQAEPMENTSKVESIQGE